MPWSHLSIRVIIRKAQYASMIFLCWFFFLFRSTINFFCHWLVLRCLHCWKRVITGFICYTIGGVHKFISVCCKPIWQPYIISIKTESWCYFNIIISEYHFFFQVSISTYINCTNNNESNQDLLDFVANIDSYQQKYTKIEITRH